MGGKNAKGNDKTSHSRIVVLNPGSRRFKSQPTQSQHLAAMAADLDLGLLRALRIGFLRLDWIGPCLVFGSLMRTHL